MSQRGGKNILICVTGTLIARLPRYENLQGYRDEFEQDEKDVVHMESDSDTDDEFILSLSQRNVENKSNDTKDNNIREDTNNFQQDEEEENYIYMGSKYVGKTTVADMLSNLLNEKCVQVKRMSFAQPLKKMIIRKMNLNPNCLKYKEKSVQLGDTSVTPRHLMQQIGTNVVRHYDGQYWVNQMRKNIEKYLRHTSLTYDLSLELRVPQHVLRKRFHEVQVPVTRSCVIVDDVRFENELESLQHFALQFDMSFLHIVLVREKKLAENERIVESVKHESEQTDFYALSKSENWSHDYVYLFNNVEKEALNEKCRRIIELSIV